MTPCAGAWPRQERRSASPWCRGRWPGSVPWWLTGWRLSRPLAELAPLRVVGAVLVATGAGGLYRHVRNPMYLAVVAAIVGQALLLWQPVLVVYAAVVAVAFVVFVLGYEQPTLQRQFGSQYEAYRRGVPAWWPRLRPWRPEQEQRPLMVPRQSPVRDADVRAGRV